MRERGLCADLKWWNSLNRNFCIHCTGIAVIYALLTIWCRCVARIYNQLRGSICLGYMCILLYLLDLPSLCSGMQGIYAQLTEESICHRYICIVLYMKCIWCNGLPEIYAWLEEGVGSICHGHIWNIFGVMVFQRSMLDWRRGWGQSAICICAFCYMWDFLCVMV